MNRDSIGGSTLIFILDLTIYIICEYTCSPLLDVLSVMYTGSSSF